MTDAPREAEMLAFEDWMRRDSTLPLDRDSFDYADFHVAVMWHAWEARAALAAPAVPAGWQPIEKAPKDGSLLMLLEKYETEPFFGRWNDFRGRWVASTMHYDTDGNACVVDRIYSEGVAHWMPLPAAPGAPDAPQSNPQR